jgi:Family of unknown function (DUF6281)
MHRRAAAGALAAVLLVAATACGGTDADGLAGETTGVDVSAAASCPFLVRYQDVLYESWGVGVAPPAGPALDGAVLVECDDGSGASGGEEIEVAELPGVSPDVALVVPGFDDSVLVRQGATLPPEVEALQRAPVCDPNDAPFNLAGPWLGILGADGHTELDLKPPYDVDLFVETSSTARYERAFLTVRVPASLREPLTRADVESSLWEGGTVSTRVRCGDEGSYLAERIAAAPPR